MANLIGIKDGLGLLVLEGDSKDGIAVIIIQYEDVVVAGA